MTSSPNAEDAPRIGLRIGLWLVQILLAVLFGMSGWFKLSLPVEELALRMPWVGAVPWWLARFIGATELSAAVGLVLPSITRIKPQLTALAAVGLVVVMILAAVFHATRSEFPAAGGTLFLACLALFVAWGRARRAPIHPR